MRVNNIQNCNSKPSFGTFFGVELAQRVMLAGEKGMLNSEHAANIERIKKDGNMLILELADKFKIISKGNKKGVFQKFLYLTLTDVKGNVIELKDMSDVLTPFSNQKSVFHLSKFLKIFSDEYKLADKIAQNSITLEK